MLRKLLLLAIPFLCFGFVGCDTANAQGSAGSYGGAIFDGSGLLPWRANRVAARRSRIHARQAARASGYGSAGSHGYGSAGSTSYQSAGYGSAGSSGSFAPEAPAASMEAPIAEPDFCPECRRRLISTKSAAKAADRVTASPPPKTKRLTFASVAADLMKLKENPLDRIDPGSTEAIHLVSR